MATLTTGALTLADWAKRLDPDGRVPVVAELLSQSNEILEDCVFQEGNLPTGHRVTIRTGLPSVYWRSLNQGVPSSKSTTAQVDESVGMLEAYCRVDKDLAELNGNTAQFRLSEDTAFLEAMNQTQAQTCSMATPQAILVNTWAWPHALARSLVLVTHRTCSTLAAHRPTTLPSGWWVGARTPCSAHSLKVRRPV